MKLFECCYGSNNTYPTYCVTVLRNIASKFDRR